MMLEEERRRTY